MACCIDVSYAQGSVNWAKVKQENIRLAVLRAGYGREYPSQVDAQFYSNIKGCQQNNIPFAIYWYAYADSVEDAIKEANACYNTIKNISGIQFVAYDVEDTAQSNLKNTTLVANMSNTFLDFFKAKGYKTIFYSYKSFIANSININAVKSHGHKIWMAYYSGNPNTANHSDVCDIWQYSSTEKVNGINGSVDMNVCYDNSLFNNLSTSTDFQFQYKSDTPSTLNLMPNSEYTFKITANEKVKFVGGNSNLLSVQFVKQQGNDYFYKIISNKNKGDVGIYISSQHFSGARICVVHIDYLPFICDTHTTVPVKLGQAYQAKINCIYKPVMVCGTNNVCKMEFVKQVGRDWFVKFYATGKHGTCTGVYINGTGPVFKILVD